jgi:hypothetical protein
MRQVFTLDERSSGSKPFEPMTSLAENHINPLKTLSMKLVKK